MIRYRSPTDGRQLHFDSAHSLADGTGGRWPVIDGIPYLRVGSEVLATTVLRHLDDGDPTGALVLLLAENDSWWTEPPPPPEDLAKLVAQRGTLNLREAMRLLGWGRVGDYFAHRWSDPTYVAGLTLLNAHWVSPDNAFELACGIGHYLRAMSLVDVPTIGADVVFAKLWVARNWVAPQAELVCFDANYAWPIEVKTDLAFCHDAFYFLASKKAVAKQLREVAPVIALAHIHNANHPSLSAAHGMTFDEVNEMFPDATFYDDEELTRAGAAGDVPATGSSGETEAFGVVVGAQPTDGGPLDLPQGGRLLRRNPLCVDGSLVWPSERYAEEYAGRLTFDCHSNLPETIAMAPEWEAAARRRELVDLPERW